MTGDELDRKVLVHSGSFKKVRYWLRGHVLITRRNAHSRYITGLTGPETEVTEDIVEAIPV